MKGIDKITGFVTKNPTRVIAIVLVVVILLVLIKPGKRIKQLFFKKDETDLLETVGNDIATEQSQGEQASYSQTEYDGFASQLFTAMNQAFTDTDAIYTVFGNMYLKIDVLMLIEAYGMRQLYFFGMPDGEPANLSSHLVDEGVDLAEINATLSGNNVNFIF